MTGLGCTQRYKEIQLHDINGGAPTPPPSYPSSPRTNTKDYTNIKGTATFWRGATPVWMFLWRGVCNCKMVTMCVRVPSATWRVCVCVCGCGCVCFWVSVSESVGVSANVSICVSPCLGEDICPCVWLSVVSVCLSLWGYFWVSECESLCVTLWVCVCVSECLCVSVWL